MLSLYQRIFKEGEGWLVMSLTVKKKIEHTFSIQKYCTSHACKEMEIHGREILGQSDSLS